MDSLSLARLLQSKLGEFRIRKDEIVFRNCPTCGNDRWNFQVNSDKKVFSCWVCSAKGTVGMLCVSLGLVIKDLMGFASTGVRPEKPKVELDLSTARKAKITDAGRLFAKKGLTAEDLEKYGFLIGTRGKWRDKLVMPLYEGKKLVYAVARDLLEKGRYYNLEGEKAGLLPYFLGDKNRYCLYLCEGVFDAVSVNKVGYSSAVLLGTSLTNIQMSKIRDFGFNRVVVCLDGDAGRKAIALHDRLMRVGLEAYVVFFNHDDEPNDFFVRDESEFRVHISHLSEITLNDRISRVLSRV